jgi:hypothetical protein
MTGSDRLPADPHIPPELSRPLPVARIGAGLRVVVEAKPEECAALAIRMGVLAVQALTCRFDLNLSQGGLSQGGGEGATIEAAGRLRARVRQTCVVSLEPFEAEVMEDFAVCFVPEGMGSDELDLEAEDEIPYQGTSIDLGEAASEQLALALDPFPRKPGAEMPGPVAPHESGAFAALAKLLPPH